MPDLINLVEWEGLLFLLALAGILFGGLITGSISARGLLMRKEGDQAFSPERVQLLVATIVGAFYYLQQVLRDPTHLPSIPSAGLGLFAGSHFIYLARRLYLVFSKRRML